VGPPFSNEGPDARGLQMPPGATLGMDLQKKKLQQSICLTCSSCIDFWRMGCSSARQTLPMAVTGVPHTEQTTEAVVRGVPLTNQTRPTEGANHAEAAWIAAGLGQPKHSCQCGSWTLYSTRGKQFQLSEFP